MRRNRGSAVIWLLWFWPLWLAAAPLYEWSEVQSATRAAQHEAVVVEYTCRFASEGYEYIIAFDPPKETEDYRLVLDTAREQIIDNKRVNTYRYVVFPKKAGTLRLAFSVSMEHTSKAAIEDTVIGRDNVRKIDYTTRIVALPEVTVAVTPNAERIAGHLQLTLDIDSRTVDAFVPVQAKLTLGGYGNLDGIEPFSFDIPGVKQFADDPEKRLTVGDNGFSGNIVQRFAFVSDRNFTIPALTLRYYDTRSKSVVTLRTEQTRMTVRPAEIPAAVPVPQQAEGSALLYGIPWLLLALAFVAGVVVGRLLLPIDSGSEAPLPPFERLMRCRDAEKFVVYLAMANADKYRGIIAEIERTLAEGKKVDLRLYKRRLKRGAL